MARSANWSEGQLLADRLRHHQDQGLRIQSVHYDKGQALFAEGEPAYWLFYLQAGEVDLVKHTPDGRRCVIQRLGSNELPGIEALLPDKRRRYTAQAVSDVDAFLIESRDAEHLLSDREFSRSFIQTLVQMMSDGAIRIEYLLHGRGSLEKVAGALLCLSRNDNGHAEHHHHDQPACQLTHAEIASFIGVREETVCHQMKRLRRRKAVISANGDGMRLETRELKDVLNLK